MSDPNEQPDPHEAARDRLTDRVLAEAFGGEQPPDLADAILNQAEEQKVSVASQETPSNDGRSRKLRFPSLVEMGVVVTCCGLLVALMLPAVQSARQAGRVAAHLPQEESFETDALAVLPKPDANELRYQTPSAPVTSEEAIVSSDQERYARVAGPETLTEEAAPAAASVDFVEEPMQVADGRGLQKTERRLGPASIFNTNPAQGSVPKIEYRVSEETKRGLAATAKQRHRFGMTSGGRAGAPIEQAGESLPSPYYLTDDVQYYAPAKPKGQASEQLARSPQASADEKRMRPSAVALGVPVQVNEGAEVQPRSKRANQKNLSTFSEMERAKLPGRTAGRSDQGYASSADKLYWTHSDKDGSVPAASKVRKQDLRWFEPVELGAHLGDQYTPIHENPFITPKGGDALSTFSIDVDTASYANARQYLMQSRLLPPASAVRVEELINYFDYGYEGPAADSEDPFAASMEVQACPWKPNHQLVRIGIKGREVAVEKRPLSNLVFLVDVSGSMNQPNKLPLVVSGLQALTDRLGENDRVAIVVYAGSEGVVLPSTSGEQRDEIRSALSRLRAGGSTAGGAGLKLAYEIAERNQIPGGVNRVVLCTDGDFNVGLTGTEELTKLVETRAKETGVFLTVLGFGRGNLNDAMLESISGRGDGHYAYIDSEKEARRVLSRNLSGTLLTIAKDVKLQVEFNPVKVASYRLVGYENRVMAAKDFNDDTKDAGEIGAGHTVTALYEVVPVGAEPELPPVDGLKYQQADGSGPTAEKGNEPVASEEPAADSNELLTLKIRYKQPTGGASKKLEFPLLAVEFTRGFDSRLVSDDFRWAAAVAEFGLLLRGSQHAGDASFDSVLELARPAIGDDPQGYRAELLDLVNRAKELRGE